MPDSPYLMRISLNVLNHMGLYLYSNTPAVLAEAIANAWDADATEVHVDLDKDAHTIFVRDNGVGMSRKDINEKFLYVGYRKRNLGGPSRTPLGRKPMGRKGIGKLSLFSIANRISVYTRKVNEPPEAFLMDAQKIKDAMEIEDPSKAKEYAPESITFTEDIPSQGTTLKIEDIKKLRITTSTIVSLTKRIARRFSILDKNFRIFINEKEVSFQDRDYFHKARFIFQYHTDYSPHCPKLDRDPETKQAMKYDRPHTFDADGKPSGTAIHKISGWIAIARRSNDLDGEDREDNLNKIAVLVRGKVAQEDILQDFRLGGMITKYMFGEIVADFLDEDDKDDIATSSRQSISEDDPRFKALKSFLLSELKHIRQKTNKLKETKGLHNALQANPPLKDWYRGLPKSLRPSAAKIFAEIDKANLDEDSKKEFYANGVLAFERLKMDEAMGLLKSIDESNVESFLGFLADVDAIEAAKYREIVNERLQVIKKFQAHVTENARERILQEYIFDHLWLLDPAWERATRYADMEKRIQAVLLEDPGKEATLRTDIRYRRVGGAHVIVELKRSTRHLAKTDIEKQLTKYIRAVRAKIKTDRKESFFPIEAVCLVGKLPIGWDDAEERRREEDSLRPLRIRVVTYSELISNAESAYAKFLDATSNTVKLNVTLDRIRQYVPESNRRDLSHFGE